MRWFVILATTGWHDMIWLDLVQYFFSFWSIYKQTNKQNKKGCHAEHDTCKIPQTNLTLKIIGGCIQRPNMEIIFKFQVNQMKMDDFRNRTEDVDRSPILTFWWMLTSKFSDLICKSSSNFNSIGWIWTILEIRQSCWPFDLKINRLFPYDELYHFIKFREDRF